MLNSLDLGLFDLETGLNRFSTRLNTSLKKVHPNWVGSECPRPADEATLLILVLSWTWSSGLVGLYVRRKI